MILYRADASFRLIAGMILNQFRIKIIPDKPQSIDRQVMQAVGYCTQIRVKHACQPVFNSLADLEKRYASLDYVSRNRRPVVVNTNMGLLFQTNNSEGIL